MKSSIAVTLIITGALLIMVPPLADFLYQRNVVALLATPGSSSVHLAGQLSDVYSFGCWLTGSLMIAIAVFQSLRAARLHNSSALKSQTV